MMTSYHSFSLCRLCLGYEESFFPIFSSFESDLKAITLAMKISICTSTQVSLSDDLPKQICMSCRSFVEQWYIFRQKCLKNNSILIRNVQENQCLISKQLATCQEPNCINTASGIECSAENGLKEANTCVSDLGSLKPSLSWIKRDEINNKVLGCHNAAGNNKDNFNKKKSQRLRFKKKCCDIIFFSRNLYKFHVSNKHANEMQFTCDVCGKQNFTSEETLKRHKMLHTGRYQCAVCGRTFTCHASLRLHERDKHENDRPFVCDVCGKAFVSELRLNYHQRFHTGEKKYVCEECGIAVVTSSSLAKHKRIHSKIKPHVCHICEKGFVVKGRLVEHLRTHTGERPFVCDVCCKAFTMQDKLRRHVKTHLHEKPFACNICGNAYTTNHGLSVHQKLHYAQQ